MDRNLVDEAKKLGKEGEKLLSEIMTYDLKDSDMNFCNEFIGSMIEGLLTLDENATEEKLQSQLNKTKEFNKKLTDLLNQLKGNTKKN